MIFKPYKNENFTFILYCYRSIISDQNFTLAFCGKYDFPRGDRGDYVSHDKYLAQNLK